MKAILFVVLAALAAPAHAYMGPGAGLGMLGSLVAVAGALLLAVFGLLVLPVRIILKRRRKATEQKSA
jgi:hypothetical protein